MGLGGILCNFHHVKPTHTEKCDDNAEVGDDLYNDQTPEPWFEETPGLSE